MLDELENQIVALYAKGMSTRDIQELLSNMYGFEISPSLISKITDRILPRLSEWQQRPLKDVFIFSIDGLSGLEKAIEAAFPRADVQRCVVHQIRNSLRYVSWKDRKELAGMKFTQIYGYSQKEDLFFR